MKKQYFKYIAAVLLFGSNGIIAKGINLSSTETVLLRTLIGSIFLLIVFFTAKNNFTFYNNIKSFVFLAISGISMGASWMLLYEAYKQVGVSLATLLYYCGPVIVMIFSPLLFKERLTAPKIAGFLAVLLGVFLLSSSPEEGSINRFGMFCGIMSAITYSVMVISNKKATGIVGFENSVLQLIISFITVAVYMAFKQGIIFPIPPESIAPILVLGILNTGVGCYLYFSSIGSLPAQTVAVCGYIEPLSAVVLSYLFLHEVLMPLQITGAVLILGGAMLGECQKSAKRT